MLKDSPQGNPTRQQTNAIFGKIRAIGDTRREEAPPVSEPEPVDEEAQEPVAAEEVDSADDVAEELEQEPDVTPEPSDEEVFIVKVDGQEVEVTLDELQAGYSRQSDYTRKTQALSADRKELETERQQTAQVAEVLSQRLSEVENLLSQATQEPNWAELSKSLDPREYNLARAQWDQQQRQLQTIQAQKEEVQRIQAHEHQRQLQLAQQQLPQLIPEWNNAETARTEAQSIREYALSVGFAEEALDSLVDPLAVKVLRDAWRYSELEKAKPKIRRKRAPKTARAGSGMETKTKRQQQAEKALRGPVKGKSSEAAAFFQNIKPIR